MSAIAGRVSLTLSTLGALSCLGALVYRTATLPWLGALFFALAWLSYPVLRRALSPRIFAPVAPSLGDRVRVRGALVVALPVMVCLLVGLSLGNLHRRSEAEREGALAEESYAQMLGGEARSARVLEAAGVAVLHGRVRSERLSSEVAPSTVSLIALGVGLVAALLGAFTAARAGRALQGLSARVSALSPGGAASSDTHSALPTAFSDELRALTLALDALTVRMLAMSQDRRRALLARREAARLRSFVLAGVSHDLRGPLNAVLGFTGLLLAGVEGPITPEQRESLEAIQRGGRDLLQRVDDLLDAARLDAERMTLDLRPHTLAALLAAAQTSAEERLSDIAIPLPPDPAWEPVWVRIDLPRAARALGSFLAFARLRPGATGAPSVTVDLGDPQRLAVHITAPGPALSPEALAQWIEPFDLPTAGQRLPAGLGLALSVARQVLGLHATALTMAPLSEGVRFTARFERTTPS